MDNNQWGNNSQNNWGGQSNNQNQWNQPQENSQSQWNQPQQNSQNQWGQPQTNWGANQSNPQNQWTQQPQNQWNSQPVNDAWGTQPPKKKKGCLFWGLLIGGILLFLIIAVIIGVVWLGFGIYSAVENSIPDIDSGYESIIEDDDKDDYESLFEDDEENVDVNLYSLFKGTWDLNLFTGAEGPTDISAMSVRLNKDGTFRMDYSEGDDYVAGTYTVKALNKDTNFDYSAEYFEIEMELEEGSLNGKDVTTGSAEYEVVLLNDRKNTKFRDSSDIEGTFWMNTRSYNMYWSGNSFIEDILDNHSLSNMDLD